MSMRVLFPADYFKPQQPDELFQDQARAFAQAGFAVSAWPQEQGSFRPALQAGETVLYRGWMLNAEAYEALDQHVRAAGAQLLTSPTQYLAAHHLPNWYPLVREFTPETVCFSDLTDIQEKLEQLGWDGFFIKDYVKSLKTSRGSRLENLADLPALMQEMRDFRGQIEGGLCVRQLEAFKPETEQRFFMVQGTAYSPDGAQVPELVQQVTQRVQLPFYSIDLIQRQDGVWRVVELGDGQVSDLVGWSVQRFVEVWNLSSPDRPLY